MISKQPEVLLINPPIYDFSAYDFWLRPYGMLQVAGMMRQACRLTLFNYMRTDKRDAWGRGRFHEQILKQRPEYKDIPRYFRRFGQPREELRNFLARKRFDAILVQTGMTYWYPGVREVLEDARQLQPEARIVLGGVYATLCPDHAKSLGPDLVVEAGHLQPLWDLLQLIPSAGPAFWDFDHGGVGVIKIADGCPFRCTYCAVPTIYPPFKARPTMDCIEELRHLARSGCRQVAFYDDALLFRPEQAILPFLEQVLIGNLEFHFHTPNALNARFMTAEIAKIMVRAGFRSFFLGLESSAGEWQGRTGSKVQSDEFAQAVAHLRGAGADNITSYIIVGHPESESQKLEATMRFAHACGARILLSDFSPLPGTPDGEKSLAWADMNEPLAHNKTAFTIRRLGWNEFQRLKVLCRELNRRLTA